MTEPLWVVVIVATMFGVGWLAVRWLTKRGAAEYRKEAAKLERISLLSLEDAASRAAPLLSSTSVFRCVESLIDDDALPRALAPELRRLLGRYESIEVINGSMARVTRSSIGPSTHQPGFLRMGEVAGGTDVEGEIGVRPGEEMIYELYPDEAPDRTFGTYRSIHHWLLAMAQETEAR